METKNRQKLLIIVVITMAALYIGDVFVFTPMVASWKDRSQRIDDMRKKVANGKYMVSRQDAILGHWEQMRTNALPANVSQAEAQMLKSFDRWERASGIARLSIKPQWKGEADDEFMTLELHADYAGDVDRLTRFLYEVEKDPLGLKVDSVEISSRDDNGRQLALGLQVSGLLINPNPAPKQQ